jgi:hypothetical protein
VIVVWAVTFDTPRLRLPEFNRRRLCDPRARRAGAPGVAQAVERGEDVSG